MVKDHKGPLKIKCICAVINLTANNLNVATIEKVISENSTTPRRLHTVNIGIIITFGGITGTLVNDDHKL